MNGNPGDAAPCNAVQLVMLINWIPDIQVVQVPFLLHEIYFEMEARVWCFTKLEYKDFLLTF
eukprot:1159905-Pelagomonas_calceolata.AAC.7